MLLLSRPTHPDSAELCCEDVLWPVEQCAPRPGVGAARILNCWNNGILQLSVVSWVVTALMPL
jgi:hypothetical protein